MEELNQLTQDFDELRKSNPDLFSNLEYIASLTRQLSVPYKYLGLLIFSNDEKTLELNRPALISNSVLDLYEGEVKKVSTHPEFNAFVELVNDYQNVTYSQMFLLILGAEPSFVFQNTIIK